MNEEFRLMNSPLFDNFSSVGGSAAAVSAEKRM